VCVCVLCVCGLNSRTEPIQTSVGQERTGQVRHSFRRRAFQQRCVADIHGDAVHWCSIWPLLHIICIDMKERDAILVLYHTSKFGMKCMVMISVMLCRRGHVCVCLCVNVRVCVRVRACVSHNVKKRVNCKVQQIP
jgi:hypothetical protein